MLRIRHAAAAVVLLLSAGTAAVAPAHAADAGRAGNRPPKGLSTPGPGYSCGPWKKIAAYPTYYPYQYGRQCVKITKTHESFDQDFATDTHNTFKHQRESFSCAHSNTTTSTYQVSADVKLQAGLIFDKVEITLHGAITHSVETTNATSSAYQVPPQSWAHCRHGVVDYTFRGISSPQYWNFRGDHKAYNWKYPQKFTGHAPSHERYLIGPGKLK